MKPYQKHSEVSQSLPQTTTKKQQNKTTAAAAAAAAKKQKKGVYPKKKKLKKVKGKVQAKCKNGQGVALVPCSACHTASIAPLRLATQLRWTRPGVL
jgi:hypothetical protein